MSIREIFSLYKMLPKDDNVLEMMKNMSPEVLARSLRLLYGNRKSKDMIEDFLVGLEKSGYFSFQTLMLELRK